jgi:hypothetical protein
MKRREAILDRGGGTAGQQDSRTAGRRLHAREHHDHKALVAQLPKLWRNGTSHLVSIRGYRHRTDETARSQAHQQQEQWAPQDGPSSVPSS